MQVNGQSFNIQELKQPTLLELLEHFNLEPHAVAVEHNGAILPRTGWEQVALQSEDNLELIRFVGGG